MVANRRGMLFSERCCAKISYFTFRRSLIVLSYAKTLANTARREPLVAEKRRKGKNVEIPSLCGLLLIKQASVLSCAELRIAS